MYYIMRLLHKGQEILECKNDLKVNWLSWISECRFVLFLWCSQVPWIIPADSQSHNESEGRQKQLCVGVWACGWGCVSPTDSVMRALNRGLKWISPACRGVLLVFNVSQELFALFCFTAFQRHPDVRLLNECTMLFTADTVVNVCLIEPNYFHFSNV